MTIRDLCVKVTCLDVTLCARSHGHRSPHAERIDYFHYTTGDETRHPAGRRTCRVLARTTSLPGAWRQQLLRPSRDGPAWPAVGVCGDRTRGGCRCSEFGCLRVPGGRRQDVV